MSFLLKKDHLTDFDIGGGLYFPYLLYNDFGCPINTLFFFQVQNYNIISDPQKQSEFFFNTLVIFCSSILSSSNLR